MALPTWLARVNRRITNPVMRRVVVGVPGFGIVVHLGRASGATYRTPVNGFRRQGQRVIALTYGADAKWVRNVLAAEHCTLERRGRIGQVTHPRIVVDPTHRLAPAAPRPLLGLLGGDEFLVLDAPS